MRRKDGLDVRRRRALRRRRGGRTSATSSRTAASTWARGHRVAFGLLDRADDCGNWAIWTRSSRGRRGHGGARQPRARRARRRGAMAWSRPGAADGRGLRPRSARDLGGASSESGGGRGGRACGTLIVSPAGDAPAGAERARDSRRLRSIPTVFGCAPPSSLRVVGAGSPSNGTAPRRSERVEAESKISAAASYVSS